MRLNIIIKIDIVIHWGYTGLAPSPALLLLGIISGSIAKDFQNIQGFYFTPSA